MRDESCTLPASGLPTEGYPSTPGNLPDHFCVFCFGFGTTLEVLRDLSWQVLTRSYEVLGIKFEGGHMQDKCLPFPMLLSLRPLTEVLQC